MLVDGLKPALISSLVGQLARGEKLDSRVAKSECQNSSCWNALDKKEFQVVVNLEKPENQIHAQHKIPMIYTIGKGHDFKRA